MEAHHQSWQVLSVTSRVPNSSLPCFRTPTEGLCPERAGMFRRWALTGDGRPETAPAGRRGDVTVSQEGEHVSCAGREHVKVPISPVGSYRRCNSPGLGMYEMRLGDSAHEDAVLLASRVELVNKSGRGDGGRQTMHQDAHSRYRTVQNSTQNPVCTTGKSLLISIHPSRSMAQSSQCLDGDSGTIVQSSSFRHSLKKGPSPAPS